MKFNFDIFLVENINRLIWIRKNEVKEDEVVIVDKEKKEEDEVVIELKLKCRVLNNVWEIWWFS